MPEPVRVALNGAHGRMGRALQELLRNDGRFNLAARVDASGGWADAPKLDVMVDFSSPAGFDAALGFCRGAGVALVSGTTGLQSAQQAAIAEAAREIPILHSANFSLGVAVLTKLVREAAATLQDWDLEILEAHHAGKADAPSGTALALGRAAAEARDQDFDAVAVRARQGQSGPRSHAVIGFAALRAGDLVGEHTVLMAGEGERLELSHRATDRAIFARGALTAAAWIAGRQPGTYTVADVIAR